MIKPKINILEELKAKGYSSYKLRKEKIFGERVITQLRNGELVSNACLDKLCKLLECQPADLIEYVPDDDE